MCICAKLVAIWFGHMDVAEMLLQQQLAVYVNFFGDFHNNSALNLDNHEMTAVLLARDGLTKATVNLRNHMGQSPIHDKSVATFI